MKTLSRILRLLASITLGYAMFQQIWVLYQLRRSQPEQTLRYPQNRAAPGISYQDIRDHGSYEVQNLVEDGIERVIFRPKEPRFQTPILFQHGMWHAAWSWGLWQAYLAELGWESHAISLPGHGGSPEQRPIRLCTLDYYLSFLRDEIDRFEQRPVLVGHSMGGALAQWYLKYIGDDLPAAVLVSSWVSDSLFKDGWLRIVSSDPAVVPLTMLSWDTSSWVRSPERSAQKLLSPGAAYTPDELFTRLGPASVLAVYQQNPPFWRPPGPGRTPMLVLAGEADTMVSVAGLRQTAAQYRGDFAIVESAAHNIMMEHNWRQSAQFVQDWLLGQGVT